MAEPHNEQILRDMADAVEGQVENLDNQIAQINEQIDNLEGEVSVIENTVMTKAANELLDYLDSTKVIELNQIYGSGCSTVTGPLYNDIPNINTANLTDWRIIDATANVVYVYLGIGWDSDLIVTGYISDWDFGKDYLIHPLNTFDGNYGLYPNISALTLAVETLTATKAKLIASESILKDYYGQIPII